MSNKQIQVDTKSANYKAGVNFSENNLRNYGFTASQLLFSQRLNSTEGDKGRDKPKSEQEFLLGAWDALKDEAERERVRMRETDIKLERLKVEQAKKREMLKKKKQERKEPL